MSINVLYFGEIREQINLSSEAVQLPEGCETIRQLLDHLIARGDPWSGALGAEEPLRIAINQEMATQNSRIPPLAEIAFFRPVTGG